VSNRLQIPFAEIVAFHFAVKALGTDTKTASQLSLRDIAALYQENSDCIA